MPRGTDTLKTYRAKRNFEKTPEPLGSRESGSGASFVVQKHAARRLHYDFRLELDGVLKSWAVTRGPSLDPRQKRLAVRTEDHPLSYASFEGTIPKGEYGAGTVLTWDRGRWQPHGDPHQGLDEGMLKFDLEGERLKGSFALVRMKPKSRRETRENWLLIKERDRFATDQFDPTERWTGSINAGRKKKPATAPGQSPTRHYGRPAFVPPQLATEAEFPPSGEHWVHEIKYDGYRILAARSGKEVTLYARSGGDWTRRMSSLAKAIAALPAKDFLIDGEAVVLTESGHSDFGALQRDLKSGGKNINYYAFDLLRLDGRDLKGETLLARKAELAALLENAPEPIRYSEHMTGDGKAVMAQAAQLGLEGIVSKRADRPYQSGRTSTWIKAKCARNGIFVVGGYRVSKARDRDIASLLLGEWVDGELIYRGRVGTGYDARDLEMLGQRFERNRVKTSPFSQVPADVRRDARWVKPELTIEVEYSDLTHDGAIRHGRFKRIAEGASAAPGKPKMQLTLTHPDRLLFEEDGITKRRLAEYLELVADRMLPYAADHPLSLIRAPDGDLANLFYQRHPSPGMPDVFKTLKPDPKEPPYLYISDEEGLLACAQFSTVEFHIWGVRVEDLEHPDRLVLDLDPDTNLPFAEVKAAARSIRDILGAAGLESFPLLTGGKGIHVVAPLSRHNTWEEVAGFTSRIARMVADADPDRFVANMSKARRKGRIFIDWHRNRKTATAVAPYSPRAKPNAPVATPVSWTELGRVESPAQFTISAMARRLSRLKREPWDRYFKLRQSIPDLGSLSL